jgi:hypothetical protein
MIAKKPAYSRVRAALAALLIALTWISAGCGGAEVRERERARLTHEAQEIVRSQTVRELERFGNDDELRQFARRMAEAQRLERRAYAEVADEASPSVTAQQAPPSPGESEEGADGESITNNQVAGVDEGGIVKVHGDHLVVLRRGRLFTIRIGDRDLRPVAMMDAYPQGAPGGWYDEMLVHDDTVVVVGYNYHEGGTELGLFDIDDDGQLRRRGTHYLRSNDYYSSRNYASRLLGDRLVFYMPYYLLNYDTNGPGYSLPAVRSRGGEWNEVITSNHVYRPVQTSAYPALHTVVSCDLARAELQCTAQGIIGPAGRSFFVSQNAVYIWVGGEQSPAEETRGMPTAVVYRLPFDGSAPGAVRVSGMPTDQFSFQEDGDRLNVLVRAETVGDWMWAPEVGAGDIALASLPLALFTDGLTNSPAEAYTRLPRVAGDSYAFQNRFVGDHVLYGTGGGWGGPTQGGGQVIVHAVDDGGTSVVPLPHGVDRIEVMGRDAVVIGAGGGNLHFSAVDLDRDPGVVGHYEQRNATQGETRSHGFFYRPETETTGVLGLPIRGGARPGYEHLFNGSAGVLFLRVDQRQFSPLGELGSRDENVDDRCQASCVDWYGNARPIFMRGRVFALLGYEIVEGRMEGSAIREVNRTNFYRAIAR